MKHRANKRLIVSVLCDVSLIQKREVTCQSAGWFIELYLSCKESNLTSMKNPYCIILILILAPLHLVIAQNELKIEDFSVEEVYVEKHKSSYYLLHLKDSINDISIRVFSQPIEIIDSYFDSTYLIFVFKSKRGFHYLAGVYREENTGTWESDYFNNMSLDFQSGAYKIGLKKAKFIDGETLMLASKVREINKEPYEAKYIYRICRDQIWIYNLKSSRPADVGHKPANNPIRPID